MPWKWTERNPKGCATEPVELVRPDGTLAGVQLRTLINGWGQYQDKDRLDMENRILNLLNGVNHGS